MTTVDESSGSADRQERSPAPAKLVKQRGNPGRSMIWLCGAALALNLLMVAGILALLAYHGAAAFWPHELELFELDDGSRILGEVHEQEDASIPADSGASDGTTAVDAAPVRRYRIKVANRDVTGKDFVWIDESGIVARSTPADAMLLERLEWGNFHGWPREVLQARANGEPETLARGRDAARQRLLDLLPFQRALREEIRALDQDEIGDVNHEIERLRLDRQRVEYESPSPEERERLLADIDASLAEREAVYDELAARLFALRATADTQFVVMEDADGRRQEIKVSDVVRVVEPNALDTSDSLRLYFERIWEFLSDDPREANTEGGIFPAIFGTVMMVLLMSIIVLPLGVLAALYLREYARDGILVRFVRIAVNNLAGVPSIVFGVFGLGFFVYTVGGTLDEVFYPERLPTATFGTGGILWASLTLALLTLPVVIVATEEGLAAVPRSQREGSFALGATQWETTWRVVLPAAAPGVLTGMILAMARAAGEVAPLMLVGMMKLAPAMPVDHHAPFVHLDRKFMHLGFHIYDVGFQSPNVEAAKPIVFATALLLVGLVLLMNLSAIAVRNHLRRKYASSSI